MLDDTTESVILKATLGDICLVIRDVLVPASVGEHADLIQEIRLTNMYSITPRVRALLQDILSTEGVLQLSKTDMYRITYEREVAILLECLNGPVAGN